MRAVVDSLRYTLHYLDQLTTDLSDEQMDSAATGLNLTPRWILGHLAFSLQSVGGEFGLAEWLPDSWAGTFGTGSIPQQSAGNVSRTDLLAALTEGADRLEACISRLSESELKQPLPDIRFREQLPTLLHAAVQIMVAHTAQHTGQLIIWRKLKCLPAIDQPYL